MGRCYEFGVEIHAGCEQAMVVTETGGACECRDCGTVCPGRFGACAAVVAIPRRVPPSAPAWSLPGAPMQTGRDGSAATTRGATKPGNGAGPGVSAVPPARRGPPPAPTSRPASPVRAGNGSRSANGAHNPAGDQSVGDAMEELLTLVSKLADQQAEYPPARLTESVEVLRDEVRDRDDQLAASLESYAARQRQLATEFARIGAAVDELPAALAEQLAEVGAIVAKLFKRVSDEMARVAASADRLTASVTALEESDEKVRISAAADRLAASIDALEERLGKPSSLREVLGRLR